MNRVGILRTWLFLVAASALPGCRASESGSAATAPAVVVNPSHAWVEPAAQQTFSATVTGIASPSVTWSVKQGSVGGSISPSGLYTAPASPGTYTVVAVESASGVSAEASVTVALPRDSPPTGPRSVRMVAPLAGESFTAPASLRLVASGRDEYVDINYPTSGRGGSAARVQFFVDDTMVLEQAGSEAEYWVFKGFAAGIAAGTHQVWARAIYANPDLALDSAPVTITVEAAPTYGTTVDLTADLTVSGAHEWIGTAASRIRVNGNGHRIVGTPSSVNWQYVDFHDVGNPADTAAAGIDVTVTGSATVQSCTFDWSNTTRWTLNGTATASVRSNLWRSNMRQPLGQYPDGVASGSFPAVVLRGTSTGSKVFAANNVGAGWVQLTGSARGWVVGGDTAADGNVLVGPRVGIYADNTTSGIQIRRNYSHHIYYGGWSQGSNYELGGVASVLAEHNVVAGSSWPVRGVGGEFRYNLVLDAGHQWLWADTSNGYVHHNVFVGGDADIGGLYVLYDRSGIRIQNNTFDGMGRSSVVAAVRQTAGSATLTSNLFLGIPGSPVSITGGTLAADYNLFWSSTTPPYSDGRTPAHDVHADPLLANPASRVYELDEVALWQRTSSVDDVLSDYRARYAPGVGSPATDVGDPAMGAGNDIGAVGSGTPNAADQFGK